MAAIEPVHVEDRGHVRVLTLDRPAIRNAIDDPLSRALAAALDELDLRDDLRVGVLTGAGGTFCAGMDLRAFAGVPVDVPQRALGRLVHRTRRKPMVAAIEGHAVGGGLELALTCDLIVAGRTARLGIPEVQRSLVPSGEALTRLPQRLPVGIVLELGLTGEPMTAARLYDVGLVNRVVAPGAALQVAIGVAESIAGNGPLAVAATREIVLGEADRHVEATRAQREAAIAAVNSSEDAREGVLAFLEKRPPRFSGR